MIMTTYLTKNIKTKEDKLSLCARKTICKFIVLQERDQGLNMSTLNSVNFQSNEYGFFKQIHFNTLFLNKKEFTITS